MPPKAAMLLATEESAQHAPRFLKFLKFFSAPTMRFKQGAGLDAMDKAKISGVLTALLGLGFLIFLLVRGANLPASQWPYEAFQGLLFSFSWVFGFSENTSYLISAIFVISMAAFFFLLGYKTHRLIFNVSQK